MDENLEDKIEQILTSLEGSTDTEEYDAVYKIYDYVKLYEGEPILKSVEKALPSLCKYLLDDQPYDLQGCMFSIFRRVEVSEETIQKIQELYNTAPCESLIIPLGYIDSNQFTEGLQDFVLNAVDDYPSGVISVFSGNWSRVLTPKSIDRLHNLFLRLEDIKISKRISNFSENKLLNVFCHQTSNVNYPQAIKILTTIYSKLEKSNKLNVIQSLSFFRNKGLPIFELTIQEDDRELKLETIKSLAKLGDRPAQKLIKRFKLDKDPEVVKAAMGAISDLKKRS